LTPSISLRRVGSINADRQTCQMPTRSYALTCRWRQMQYDLSLSLFCAAYSKTVF